jgi:hypothetical protein
MKQLARILIGIALFLSACGATTTTAPNASSALTPVFAFTEAVVGPNRLPIGIIRDGSPLNDPSAQITMQFYNLDVDKQTPVGNTTATYYGQGLPAAVYVANYEFPTAGNWGVEVSVLLEGMTDPSVTKLQLPVSERAVAPKVGDKAIVAETLTNDSVTDAAYLVSSTDVDAALYQVSLADALTQQKPIALLFATPGFCRTAVCGPSLTVFRDLQKQYGDKVTFIHSEIYRYPFGDSFAQQNTIFQAAMREGRGLTDEERKVGVSDAYYAWGLMSEPWMFLIDAQGVITARYEGGFTVEELGPVIAELSK